MVALGRIDDKRILESSGLAMARPAEGTDESASIWTFNDSGGEALLFLVNLKGHTEATLKLQGATNRDWEAMCSFAIDDQTFLAVGDVGDNSFKRKKVQIYVVPEPLVKLKQSRKKKKREIRKLKTEVQLIEFTYEDGNHNCEAMSYNSDDDTFWFVEKVYVNDKRKTAPGVYVLPNPLTAAAKAKKDRPKNIARRVADFPAFNVTGMAFSPDNQRLVIRNYFGASLFEKPEGKTWQQTLVETKPVALSLPLQSQGEAVCFTPDSQSLLVTSEMAKAIIWQVNLAPNASKEKK